MRTLIALQHFGQPVTDLRGEQAEPYLADLGLGRPVPQKFLQIAGLLHHLTSDRAVDRDLLADDVLEDPIIGRGSAPNIVFRL
jgi:hypothetical protein